MRIQWKKVQYLKHLEYCLAHKQTDTLITTTNTTLVIIFTLESY